MNGFPIGILLESLRLPFPQALDAARSLGVQGVQVYATNGELSPDRLTPAAKRDFLKQVKDRGLVVSAVCGDLGHGFGDPYQNPMLIGRSKRILDLSKEWECGIVTTHIGVVPPDPDHPRYRVMQDACGELARYADGIGCRFAVETGPETAATLKGFLDSLGSRGVSVNLDPANLVMVTGDDPVRAVHTLKDYIVHTHAKDGVKLFDKDPEKVYGIVRDDALVTDHAFSEVPLGEGGVDFPAYLAALREVGYKGFLTIEREVGDDPAGDIRKAVAFLRGLMG
ncbi:MAG TPA: sugar phosphate isomerase/epimerase family protein [Candidatus Limnocylindria bacterium]|nr:sugar phosphate isomerase/epimerase family protein [Candidatus Limnocylindria bacterium]